MSGILLRRRGSGGHRAGGSGGGGSNGPDDYFDYTGPAIDTTGARYSGAYPWTLQNVGAGGATVSSDQLSLLCGDISIAMDPILATQAMDAGDGAWKTQCSINTAGVVNYQGLGLVLRESSTGKMLCFGPSYDNGYKWQVRRLPNGSPSTFTNWTTNYGDIGTSDGTGYAEIVRVGSTLIFIYSEDGITWAECARAVVTADFTTAPDQVGLWTNARQAVAFTDTGVFEYFLKNDRSVPYGVPIVNPDAESAVAAPWTNVTGTLGTRAGVAHSGGFAFKIVGNPGAFEAYQEWHAIAFDALIDAGGGGGVTATLAGWGRPWEGSTSTFRIRLNAYDSGGSSLGSNATAYWSPSASMSQKSCSLALPSGTRKLRITFEGTTAASDDCWLDDLTLSLA